MLFNIMPVLSCPPVLFPALVIRPSVHQPLCPYSKTVRLQLPHKRSAHIRGDPRLNTLRLMMNVPLNEHMESVWSGRKTAMPQSQSLCVLWA